MSTPPRREGQRGSSAPLIIAFTAIILLLVAVVIDASAAYLARQRLAALADGAALYGADGGAEGEEAYRGGLSSGDLDIDRDIAERAVGEYLRKAGANRAHPGLRATVLVRADRIVVRLQARIDLPLAVPGGPGRTVVSAVGSAVVTPAR